MDFTSVSDVKLLTNKEIFTPQEENLLNMLVSNITGVIQNYCGWSILADDYDRWYNGTGTKFLDLRVYPLNSVSLLTLGDTDEGEDLTAEVSMDKELGQLFFNSSSARTFSAGYHNVHVKFNAGFDVVPNELAHAAAWLCASYFTWVTSETVGMSEMRFNDVSGKVDTTDLPPLIKRMLDRYRVPRIY